MRDFERELVARGAFTLIELLVAIAIIGMLTALAIPIISPSLKGRESRDASRLISTFISGARTRAIELGRPVGVWIDRDPNQPQRGISLAYAETPEPYCGDMMTSRATTSNSGPNGADGWKINITLPAGDVGWKQLIKVGDTVRLNSQGPLWRVAMPIAPTPMPDANGFLQDPFLTLVCSSVFAYPTTAMSVPYQIYRQPVKSLSRTLTLPPNVVIDMISSGVGFTPGGLDDLFVPFKPQLTHPPDYASTGELDMSALSPSMGRPFLRPLIIMFSPNGSIHSVYRLVFIPPNSPDPYRWEWKQTFPLDQIFLLVARGDQVPQLAEMELPNWHKTFVRSGGQLSWRDLNNVWITIEAQTGYIRPGQNTLDGQSDDPAAWTLDNDNAWTFITGDAHPFDIAPSLAPTRRFAREAQAREGAK